MPLSIALWTDDQWSVFVTTLGAGLAAAVLVYGEIVRRRRLGAPAGVHRTDRRWERRRRRAIADATGPLTPVVDAAEQQLVQAWHTDATSETVGIIAAAEPLVDPDVAAEIGAAFDAALEAFRVAMEPPMRTARLWTLQAGETYAAQTLRQWRLDTPTGGWPLVTRT